ncbi:thiosulfate sulfurtransferase GlpE [Alphaproteobacteria bacterium]|nr:thiosulfate sulfurtransferase GlpE [Alphaproteobacteria bacterium]MDC1023164.1 thiosulfate sulfurtransferase GlpE [Alphaproteobacteria bacterium]
MSFQCISIEDAKTILNKDNLTIIDIRDRNSFSNGHIDNAIHVEDLDIDNFLKDKNKNETILIYCYHGNSSKSAADFFVQHGFEKVLSMDEGYSGWIKN